MALIDVPVTLTPSPAHVLGSAYTGPYGHASTTPVPLHVGDYRTPPLGTNTGTVYGTTEVKTDPLDKPVRARVLLLREKDGKVIREMWSDPVTGAYRFDDVDAGEVYTVLTYHPTRDRRAVVADGIIPEVSA